MDKPEVIRILREVSVQFKKLDAASMIPLPGGWEENRQKMRLRAELLISLPGKLASWVPKEEEDQVLLNTLEGFRWLAERALKNDKASRSITFELLALLIHQNSKFGDKNMLEEALQDFESL